MPETKIETEAGKPKASCKYSETKKLKQVHSVITNLKHKLLFLQPAIRKLTHQNKQLKAEQLLNETFSPKNI